MCKVNLLNKQKLRIQWNHNNPDKGTFNDLRDPGTNCVIRMENGSPIAMGTARSNPKDSQNFCKASGRKLSLARALKAPGFNLSKAERANIWKQIIEQTNVKRA